MPKYQSCITHSVFKIMSIIARVHAMFSQLKHTSSYQSAAYEELLAAAGEVFSAATSERRK